MRELVAVAVVWVLLAGAAVASDIPSWIGYGGPGGTRVYRDVTPPTSFSEKDIAWRAKLPDAGWGHGSPVVAGDLVILGVEFNERHNIFPSLIAFDTSDGSVVWSTLLNHLSAVDVSDEEREKILAAWKKINDWVLKKHEIIGAYRKATTDEEKAKVVSDGDAAGFKVDMPTSGRKKGKLSVTSKNRNALKYVWEQARKGGFSWATWRSDKMSSSWNVGYMYGTPVTDGKHVWAHTSFNGIFCLDLKGKIVWTAYVPGMIRYGNNARDYCKAGRSPILWEDPAGGPTLLLSDIGNTARAFNAATGELLWKHDIAKSHTIVSPMVMRVGETEILWAAGCSAYRLPDGEKLTVQGWKDEGMQSLVKYDERDVVFICGAGEHCGWAGKGGVQGKPKYNPPACIRFTLDGDTLKANVLWHGKTLAGAGHVKPYIGGNSPWMLYHANKFYHTNGQTYGALTGKVIAGQLGRYKPRAVPKSSHLVCVAGDHVYGLGKHYSRQKGAPPKLEMQIHSMDGKKVGAGVIPGSSYGYGFTFSGSDIYIRAVHELIKISGSKEDTP